MLQLHFDIFVLTLQRTQFLHAPHPFTFPNLLSDQASKWHALLQHTHHKQLLKIMRWPFSPPVTRKQSISHGCPWAETEVEPNGWQKLLSKCTWWPLIVLGGTHNLASCSIGKKMMQNHNLILFLIFFFYMKLKPGKMWWSVCVCMCVNLMLFFVVTFVSTHDHK